MSNWTGPYEPPASARSSDEIEELLKAKVLELPDKPGIRARLGRFDILERLGAGGMGVVVLAQERGSPGKVAIKFLLLDRASDPDHKQRFVNEVRYMRELSKESDDIVKVLEYSESNGVPYYVMPFYGESLGDRIADRGPLDEESARAFTIQIALTLDRMHNNGFYHRDIKPANVLLKGADRTILTDFGFCRTLEISSLVFTERGAIVGTFAYMPPGVARGKKEERSCDIYSLGATLYEMLTGRPPYEGQSPQEVLEMIRAGPPTPIRERNPDAPKGLVKIAEWAMARELRDRYASMADLVQDLERVERGEEPLGRHGRVDVPADPDRVQEGKESAAAPLGQADVLADDDRGQPGEGLPVPGGQLAPTDPPPGPHAKPHRQADAVANLERVQRGEEPLGPPGQEKERKGRWKWASLLLTVIGLILLRVRRWKWAILLLGMLGVLGLVLLLIYGLFWTRPSGPVRVVALTVEGYRGKPPGRLGKIGSDCYALRFDDRVRVYAQLNQPAWCYLIALNPDGKDQLCHPTDAATPPAKGSELNFPQDAGKTLALNDGTGLQAVVLVAAGKPLPPYADWKASIGGLPWQRINSERAWRYDGRQFHDLDTAQRGSIEDLPGLPKTLAGLCTFLKDRPEIEAIEVVAFPVRARAPPPRP